MEELPKWPQQLRICWIGLHCTVRIIMDIMYMILTRCSFFAGQMHVFRPRTDLARVLIALAPLLGAAMIAISRCEDYRHDVYDVTCGSLLGMSIGYFSYRRYYPSLRHSKCHIAYPSRASVASSTNSGGKMRDIEEADEDVFAEDGEDGEMLPLSHSGRDRGSSISR